MSTLPVRAVGIPWYELEDYPRIKAMMEDGHLLPQVYSLWRLKAEQTERQLRRQGHLVVRAALRPDEFAAWCAARNLNVNAKARMDFATQVAFDQHGKTH